MNLKSIIRPIRAGASIQNPTPFKWAGVAVTIALAALPFIQARGWLSGVSEDDIIALVLAVLSLLAQIVTTDKIGLLPAARPAATVVRDDRPVPPRDYAPVRSGPADPGQSADEFWGKSHGALDEHGRADAWIEL